MVNDEASREILKGNMGKIKAMMLVNEKLFRYEEQFSVHVHEFTTELADHLQRIYDSKGRIRIQQNISAGIQLQGKQALSFGLILSELLTNSYKYAFTDHHDPVINISMQAVDEHSMLFTYSDNGSGIDHARQEKPVTMGISLVHDLTRQMNGKITVSNGYGLTYQLLIPV
ncbi:sensor histidine kinase [Paraflavitalea speifideaquila]|uniref:sensor histidine kinase n=1 Tax=Paraflavitalea speifideaquila TaxID=3076558 RepID=UPI0028E2C883|nr:ATP-binding protein [Paraflavitalea speifideiaquila]